MSRSLMSPLCKLVLIISISLLSLGWALPVQAQINSGLGGSRASATFAVTGLNGVYVDLNGSLANKSINTCPFIGESGMKLFKTASDAAKSAGDPNGCPFAKNGDERVYFFSCGPRYIELSNMTNPDGKPNPNFTCCEFPPAEAGKPATLGTREGCMELMDQMADEDKGLNVQLLKDNQILSTKLPKPEYDKMKEEIKKTEEAENSCQGDVMKRIKDFYGKRQEVQCYKAVKNIIKNWSKEKLFDLAVKADEQINEAGTTTFTVGSAPGAITTTPAPWIAALVGQSAIKIALQVAKVASDADTLLTQLNEGCGGVISGLNAIQNFRDSLINNFSCRALEDLIVRQLTQCVRVNIGFDLSLPQFSLLLQCPININLNLNYSVSRGFNCYNDVSAGNPLAMNFGGRSLVSGSGGMKNIFSGDCFGGSDDASGGLNSGDLSGSGSSTAGGTGSRVPGIDCGPLDTSTSAKSQAINGKVYLQNGTPVATGWVVGGSETVGSLKVTRCDYYDNKRILRTNYVYGTGASCNSGSAGFLEGGYETNSACYGSGYNAASAPNVPDACMYDAACLDSSGKFSQALVGKGSCPANPQPLFNAARSYTTFKTSGLGGGDTVVNSCSEFEGMKASVQCCDPQLQDCTKRDVNVPICTCDQGDAYNRIVDPSTGQCEQGGKATCCSPRLNGKEWCEQNMGASSICAAEIGEQCTAAGAGATYVGPDGKTRPITAADLALSKPSPYIYLFVRPDAAINGQQCCMTEWCNICPQHYANAYGLSMTQANLPQATTDAGNNALIGKGWPFISTTNDLGGSSYQIGLRSITITLTHDKRIGGAYDYQVSINNPTLFIKGDVDPRPLDATMTACNNLSSTKAQFADSNALDSPLMGFVYDKIVGGGGKDETEWRVVAPVPQMKETPLAYINRIRQAFSSNGKPLEEIKLCSNIVNICIPNASESVIPFTAQPTRTSEPDATPAPTPVATPTPVAPAAVAAPVSSSGASTDTGTTVKGVATEVPSAGGGQASGSLY